MTTIAAATTRTVLTGTGAYAPRAAGACRGEKVYAYPPTDKRLPSLVSRGLGPVQLYVLRRITAYGPQLAVNLAEDLAFDPDPLALHLDERPPPCPQATYVSVWRAVRRLRELGYVVRNPGWLAPRLARGASYRISVWITQEGVDALEARGLAEDALRIRGERMQGAMFDVGVGFSR
jgi:hypothetical protein